jgi:single-stranded-DNA-specific exonuclease
MNRPENMPYKKWVVAPVVPETLTQAQVHRNPILIQVLYNRGIKDPDEVTTFLDRHYIGATDPFKLADMDRAVARIKQAIDQDEMIVVYGDFDADGVTSTVLLVEALRGLGLPRGQVRPYIPDRVDEGYGLNHEALQSLKEGGAELVISVDCGIRSIAEVSQATILGLDMIVTDHHSLGTELPPAVAVLKPKRPDSTYPEEMLAGVGIAYKVAQALKQAIPERARYETETLLDLVALGTVADLAPLLGENRQLVMDGLRVLNQGQRPGVAALAKVAGLTPGNMTAESIAFGLGPRLNAAGRLAHAYDAARLLAVNNDRMAKDYAQTLDQLNRQRQQLTKELSQRAEEMIEPGAPLLLAADPSFVGGIVGLIASRLADKHYRPAIVLEQGELISRGSCRSIPGFHITDALDKLAWLLVKHGGHAQAAGFTIENKNLAEFHERMLAIAAEELDEEAMTPSIPVDAEMAIGAVDWALFDQLKQLEPTGNANAAPLFMSHDVHVYSHRAVGQDGAHLQLWVGDGQTKVQCIAFRQGLWAGRLPDQVDLVYTINVNEWNGNSNLQLMVKDIREVTIE